MGKQMVPTRLFFTKGVGESKERSTSYQIALREAGIGTQNLVRVSSIFPPACKLVRRKEGELALRPGELAFAVVAENATCEPNRLIVSSIGIAMPSDKETHGYLVEHHAFGESEEQAGDRAEERAAELLAATLDAEFDVETSWDEPGEFYRIAGKHVRTANITQSATGHKDGLWVTVIAAAIFLFDDPD